MGQYFVIHPTHPQARLIAQAVKVLMGGGVIAYPTDATYALGCHLGDRTPLDRIRRLRQLTDKHDFTLVCRDLSELSTYARVENAQYRLIRRLTPGPYTFLLPATREVPKRLVHPKRKSVGLRVPRHPIVAQLLAGLGAPMMSTTLQLPDAEHPLSEPELFRDDIERHVDLIIDGGVGGLEPTTVLDLTASDIVVVRAGLGDISGL